MYKGAAKRYIDYADPEDVKKISVFKKFDVKIIDTENWSEKHFDLSNLNQIGISY